jgi:hypothetical protein
MIDAIIAESTARPYRHVVTLPGGRAVGLRSYVDGWRKVRLQCTVNPRQHVNGWNWYPVPAADILRDLERGMHDRINRHDRTRCAGWRKLDAEYQHRLHADAYRLRNIARRIRVYQFETEEARLRFAHLLSHHGD